MILSRFFTLLVVCGIQFASDGRSVANGRGWPERPGGGDEQPQSSSFRSLPVSPGICWAVCRAQTLYGSVVGNVRDTSQAVTTGAMVTLTSF